jgi:uncharacterized protein
MNEPQILSLIAAAAADPWFLFAVGIAVLSGLVRGFAGFGTALIFIPLISAIYGPRIAAPTLLLIDTVSCLPMTVRAFPRCNWREVAPISIASVVAIPIGAIALVMVDAQILRWAIAILVLSALATLVAGWRYHGRPTLAASLGVGALSGLGAGAVQIGAPPLLVFWLGGTNKAATVRANIIVYFFVQAMISFVVYFANGVFSKRSAVIALLLVLPYLAAIAVGAFSFRGANDALYRRVAYVIIAFAGLLSLPIFDALR